MSKHNKNKERTKKIILFTKIFKITLIIVFLFIISYVLMTMSMK